jgi:hypothetical protein
MPTKRAQLRHSTLYDWLRLRPVLRVYKTARRRAIGLAYPYKRAPDSAALSNALQQLGTRPLAITVVFNSTWMLKWQLRFAELNFNGVDRVIADNSYDPAASRAIKAICREANIHYLKLPFNRFSLGRPKDASLSHASALNWVWHNIVARVRPPVVAIIDEDLIPLDPVDIASKVADQPFFGVKLPGAQHGWTVWTGYAVYSRSIIDRYKMDFWVDGRAGLDTGGANWERVYRHFEPDQLRFASVPPGGKLMIVGRIDEWWHVGGISGYYARPEAWRADTDAMLEREYDRAKRLATADGSA